MIIGKDIRIANTLVLALFFLLQRLQRDLDIIQDSDFHSDDHFETRLSGNQLHTLEKNTSWSS